MEARTCILMFLSVLAANFRTSHQQQCLEILDMIIVMDGSNSMEGTNFEKQKHSVINLARSMSVSETEVHVGLVLYSRNVTAVIDLTGDNELFTSRVLALEYPDEDTRTDLGIDEAVRLFASGGRKGNVPQLMCIITDGRSTMPELTKASATAAKNKGIKIFAVGVTNSTDPLELEDIASARNQVFFTEDFATLEGSLNNATNRACVDLRCQDAVIDIVFLVSMSNVEASNFEQVKTFMEEFLFFSDINNQEIRVGFVTFTDVPTVQFNLNTHSTKTAMITAISNIQYKPGKTNIAEALKILRSSVFTRNNGDRPDVPNVVILLSTDDENVNITRAAAEADATRAAGIQIYGITIGHKSTALIDVIVSRPLAENRFVTDSFLQLRSLIPQVYDKFNKFCETPPPVPACYMGITDIWFVVEASATAEIRSRVQATGDFIELKNGLIKMIKIIEDPSVANTGIRLAFITYSGTSRVVVNIDETDSTSKTGDAVLALPNGITQGKAEMVAALGNIVTPPVNSSYRSYVAIIAPESSYISNMNTLGPELARLKGMGYTILLIVINETGSISQENLQKEASGPNFFYYINDYSNLEAATKNFTRDRLCNSRLRNSSGLCTDSGHKEKGVGEVAHPTDCDKYIQCYYNESNNFDLGVIRHCPMGLHWNQTSKKCSTPSEAMCEYDRCKEDCAPYKMDGACGAYWDCENGASTLKCCPTNYTFIPNMGCQHDNMCTDTCGQEKWCGKCQKKPNWTEAAGYDVMILGGNMWLPRPCFYEDFDIVDCDCTAPRGYVCPADRTYDFTDANTLEAIHDGNREGIRVSDVQENSDGITLGHKSAIHVSVNKPKSGSGPFTLEFRFRETGDFSPYGETLFSSGIDCGTGNSLLVSANDMFIFAEVRSLEGQVAEVKVPTKGLNKDDFKDLVLSYDEGELMLSIKDEQTQYIATTQAPSNICFSCGLDFGQAVNKLSFDGEVQEIAVYSCAWYLLY